MIGTASATTTFTHTCTYLGSKISGSLQAILTEAGLGGLSLKHDWDDLEGAIHQWLSERSLLVAVLEVFEPDSAVAVARFDVDISYVDGEPTTSFRNDLATSRLAARKAAVAHRGHLKFRIVLILKDCHSSRVGWNTTSTRSTDGMSVRSMGELAAGPGATSELRFWVRR